MIGTCGVDGSLTHGLPCGRSRAYSTRLQVAGVAERHRAHADAEPRLVHHVEHVGQSAVRLADEVADRAGFAARRVDALAEVQHRVGDPALAHLVVQAGQRDVVALADGAVGCDEVLRHDEQRDALGPGGPAGNLRQHQVDDVLAEFVFGAGDPHLRAEQPVGAVVAWLGPGEDVGQRRAGLRLGERHRAGEAAGEHRLDEAFDLLARRRTSGSGWRWRSSASGSPTCRRWPRRRRRTRPARRTPAAGRRRGPRPCSRRSGRPARTRRWPP